MKKQLITLVLLFFWVGLFSQLNFDKHIIIDETHGAMNARSVYACDLDGDGDMDVLSASSGDNKIVWYENEDGDGNFGPQKYISIEAEAAKSVFAADLDGDGDLDVLSASAYDNKIAWYENTNGDGNFGPQEIITTDAYWATSVYAADIDGDGDIDVLSASAWDNKIAWYDNINGEGDFSIPQIISVNAIGARSVFSADIDNDGDMDVISASYDDNKIAWYENVNGMGVFGIQQILSDDSKGAMSVYAGNIDGDASMDIVSVSAISNKITWFEYNNGSFNSQTFFPENKHGLSSVFITDMDGDQDGDILFTAYNNNEVAWIENIDGQGAFSNIHTISTVANGVFSAFACDLDGDNDNDVLSASYLDSKIAWYQNINGQGVFGNQNLLTLSIFKPVQIFAGDIDNDGDLDILSASKKDDKIAWYENNGDGIYGNQQIISTLADGASSIFLIDLNGDGYQDVISSSYWDDKIAWYKNLDGQGDFSNQILVSTNIEYLKYVYAEDIDNDGDMDIIFISSYNIYLCKNLDGIGGFDEPQPIVATNLIGFNCLSFSDIDKDGDLDVFFTATSDNFVGWVENMDGLGSFSSPKTITNEAKHAWCVIAGDFDGDGDMDVASASYLDNKIAWYENLDGLGNFGDQQIVTTDLNYARAVYSDDLDDDGDMDLLSISMYDNKIAWYENLDGLGGFGDQQVISTSSKNPYSLYIGDLDGDGDLDIASASSDDNTIAWYENLLYLSVEVEEISSMEILVYPNPAHEYVIFTVVVGSHMACPVATTTTTVKITNLYGQEITTFPLNQQKTKWDVSHLPKGVYFYQLVVENHFISGKIVIQ